MGQGELQPHWDSPVIQPFVPRCGSPTSRAFLTTAAVVPACGRPSGSESSLPPSVSHAAVPSPAPCGQLGPCSFRPALALLFLDYYFLGLSFHSCLPSQVFLETMTPQASHQGPGPSPSRTPLSVLRDGSCCWLFPVWSLGGSCYFRLSLASKALPLRDCRWLARGSLL